MTPDPGPSGFGLDMDQGTTVAPEQSSVTPALTVNSYIAIWSMRPAPNSEAGKAWEDGARQGWKWAQQSNEALVKALEGIESALKLIKYNRDHWPELAKARDQVRAALEQATKPAHG